MTDDQPLARVARLLIHAARHARHNAMMSDAPAAQAYYRRSTEVRPGDMVVEVSTWGEGSVLDRVGELLSAETVPWPDWGDDPNPNRGRPVWTIRTLDGRTVTWEDCEFIAVPDRGYEWAEEV